VNLLSEYNCNLFLFREMPVIYFILQIIIVDCQFVDDGQVDRDVFNDFNGIPG
jgi:hypothetical protein